MEKVKIRKNKIEDGIFLLKVINIVFILIYLSGNHPIIMLYISISSLVLLHLVVSPVIDYAKSRAVCDKYVFLSLVLRGILFVLFAISSYLTFLSEDYYAKFPSLIMCISIALIASVGILKSVRNSLNSRKSQGKRNNIFYIAIITAFRIFLFLFPIYNSFHSLIIPQRQLDLSNLKYPQSIEILKSERESVMSRYNVLSPGSRTMMTDSNDIKKFIHELQATKTTSITGVNLLKYTLVYDNKFPSYNIYFNYSNKGNMKGNIESGHIYRIRMNSDGTMVLHEDKKRDSSFLLWKYYTEKYPLRLSKEITDMIFNYIN